MKESKKIISTSKAPAAIGPYSQGVQVGNLLFASGQIPLDSNTGEIVGDDIDSQTRQVLKNASAIITKAGATIKDVVKTTVFIKNMDDFAAVNEIYKEVFTENPPARSTVEVARLPKDVLIEIEVIAVIPE